MIIDWIYYQSIKISFIYIFLISYYLIIEKIANKFLILLYNFIKINDN